jgi:preprotein translocase subunit SecE
VNEEPKFSRMIAIVAGVVALTILVFFGVGYGLGKLLL